MKHYGDITKLSGWDLPIVDVITGGSPCQDLSVAGQRKGLAGERSGLFMEQIRIVKEMRERDRLAGRPDHLCRPRFMVWENVPGAFSSGSPKGADFAAVLEEILKIVQENAHVDVPESGWTHSGCVFTEDGRASVAWRLHDAQFWGVPQRRKRIALVADFGGLAAPEIFFERKGLSRDPQPCGEAGQGAADGAESGAGRTISFTQNQRDEVRDLNDVAGALAAEPGIKQQTFVCGFKQGAGSKAGGIGAQEEIAPTLAATDSGTNQVPALAYSIQGNTIDRDAKQGGDGVNEDVSFTLNAVGRHAVAAVCVGNGQLNQISMAEQANTLDTMHDQQSVMLPATMKCGNPHDPQSEKVYLGDGIWHTLYAHETSGMHRDAFLSNQASIVRRLTPMECERLQGFPDGWTDIGEWVDSKGKKHKEADSPRYKALGNSIAVGYANGGSGFWMWLMKRISAQYERNATLGSLFDGIGGFPLAWEHYNGKGSAVWASEIEEFCIAVTKKHFSEPPEQE